MRCMVGMWRGGDGLLMVDEGDDGGVMGRAANAAGRLYRSGERSISCQCYEPPERDYPLRVTFPKRFHEHHRHASQQLSS